MRMKELVTSALDSVLDKDTEIELEEILEQPCASFHAWRALGLKSEDLSDVRRDLLRREVEREFDKTLRTYLSGAYKDGFVAAEESVYVSDKVSCRVLGSIGAYNKSFVFSCYTDAPYVMHVRGAQKAVGGFLASLLHHTNISYMVLVNRSTLAWQVWTIKVEGQDLRKALTQDADYIEGISLGLAPPEGIKEECLLCRYSADCDVEDKFVAKPYPLHTVTATANHYMTEKLNDYLVSLNDVDDGRNTGFLSPSEMSISNCDRRMVYKIRRTPRKAKIEPGLRRVFDMGHAVHEVIQRLMHQKSEEFESETKAVVQNTLISGSCDGVLSPEGLEIKSISNAGFLKLKSPKSDHKKQGATYARAFGLSKMLFVYYDKKTGDYACFYDTPSEENANETVARALRVEKMAKEERLPPRKVGWGCDTCAYKYTCKPEEEG